MESKKMGSWWRWRCTQDLAKALINTCNKDTSYEKSSAEECQVLNLVANLDNILPATVKDLPAYDVGMAALRFVEEELLNEIREAAETALESLQDLRSADVNIINFVGNKIKMFLQSCKQRYDDLINEKTKERIGVEIYTIKTVLPYLCLVIEDIQMNYEEESCSGFILDLIESSIIKIVDIFEKPSINSTPHQFENIGSFLDLMDQLLEGDQHKSATMLDLSAKVSSVIRHALTLSRVCHPADATEISLVCKSIADTLANLNEEEDLQEKQSCEARLLDLLTHLEEWINRALLRMFTLNVCTLESPLDNFIMQVLNSTIPIESRDVLDLDLFVSRLDEQTDSILNLCEFCPPSSRNKSYGRILKSCHSSLQKLEAELVPAIFQLYLYPGKKDVKRKVRFLRQLWRGIEMEIKTTLKLVVDPVAMSLVILEETKKLAKKICDGMYEQNMDSLKADTQLVIGMCETGVDITWQESNLSGKDDLINLTDPQNNLTDPQNNPTDLQYNPTDLQNNPTDLQNNPTDLQYNPTDPQNNPTDLPLPEFHPLVRTERSIWELRAASKLVQNNPKDLELHKSFVKRMKVLVNNYSHLSSFLVEKCQNKDETREKNDNSFLLAEMTAQDIENPDTMTTSQLGNHFVTAAEESKNNDNLQKTMSTTTNKMMDRTNMTKLSFYSIKDPERSRILTLSLRKDVYRLTQIDMTEFSPMTPPGSKSRIRLSVTTPESTARLSSALDRLSFVSDELSRSLRKTRQISRLETTEGVKVNIIHIQPKQPVNTSLTQHQPKQPVNTSLRRRALFNHLNNP